MANEPVRRDVILLAAAGLAGATSSAAARDMNPAATPAADETDGAARFKRMFTPDSRLPGERDAAYVLDSGAESAQRWLRSHNGNGEIGMRLFPFGGATLPTNFLIYDIPPAASEGVHTHLLDDPIEGSFDEYYYIISGEGVMQIGDQVVPVRADDHVFTPIGVPHGIENTSASENLKVFLTYIYR